MAVLFPAPREPGEIEACRTLRRRNGKPDLWCWIVIVLGCSLVPGCSGVVEVRGEPRILSVGNSPSADYASISEAISTATPHSTIAVSPGTYTEHLSISKPLTIVGAGVGTIVRYPDGGATDSAVIEVRDVSGVRIEQLVVRAMQLDVDGIRIRDATNIVLASIVVEDCTQDGIDVKRSSGITIAMSHVESNGGDGIQVDENSFDVTIVDSRTKSNGVDGFKIRSSANVLLQGNLSTLNGDDGILVRESTGVRLIGNGSFSNFDWGIRVLNSPDTFLDQNSAGGNLGGQIQCAPTACSGPTP